MASLAAFHLPGQDMVWRYVTTGSTTTLDGAHALAPKAATSGARRSGARRILTELCGAYGWRLILDEVKWLFDWHLVRGNNLPNPHAFFYSIAAHRAWESEPDLGLHNVWWPQIRHLLQYAARVSATLADAESVCDVAILGDAAKLPWQAASVLLRKQRAFNYIGADDVLRGRCRNGRLQIGGAGYRAVMVDGDSGHDAYTLEARLDELAEAGIIIVRSWAEDDDLTAELVPLLPARRADPEKRGSTGQPSAPRRPRPVFYLVNEGEQEIDATLQLPILGAAQAWDLLRGTYKAMPGTVVVDGMEVALQLPRRESLVVAVDPQGQPLQTPDVPARVDSVEIPASAWSIHTSSGANCEAIALGDWSQQPGWELFSGTLIYRAQIDLPDASAVLALGEVGEIAEYRLDGDIGGVSLWAPHQLPVPAGNGRPHELEIHVTNSMANEYEGSAAACRPDRRCARAYTTP